MNIVATGFFLLILGIFSLGRDHEIAGGLNPLLQDMEIEIIIIIIDTVLITK